MFNYESYKRHAQSDQELLATIPAIGSDEKSRLIFEKPKARSFLETVLDIFRRPIQQSLAKKRVADMLKITENNPSLAKISSVQALQHALKHAPVFTGISSTLTRATVIDLMFNGATLEPEFSHIFDDYLQRLKDFYLELVNSRSLAISPEQANTALDVLISMAKQPDCSVSLSEKIIVENFHNALGGQDSVSQNITAECGIPYRNVFDRLFKKYQKSFQTKSRIVEHQTEKVLTPLQAEKEKALRESAFTELRALAPKNNDSPSMTSQAINSFEQFTHGDTAGDITDKKTSLSDFLIFFAECYPRLSPDAQAYFLPKVILLEDELTGTKILQSINPSQCSKDDNTQLLIQHLQQAGMKKNGLSPSVANALIFYVMAREDVATLENSISAALEVGSQIKREQSESLSSQKTKRALAPSSNQSLLKKRTSQTNASAKNMKKGEAVEDQNLITLTLPRKNSQKSISSNQKRRLEKSRKQIEKDKDKDKTMSAARSWSTANKILEKKRSELSNSEENLIIPENVPLLSFAILHSKSLIEAHFPILDDEDEDEVNLRKMMSDALSTLDEDLKRYVQKLNEKEAALIKNPEPVEPEEIALTPEEKRKRDLDALRKIMPGSSNASKEKLRAFEDFVYKGRIPSLQRQSEFLRLYYHRRKELSPEIQQSLKPRIVAFEEVLFDRKRLAKSTRKDWNVTSQSNGRLVNTLLHLLKNVSSLPKSVGHSLLCYIELKERIYHLENALADPTSKESAFILKEFGNRTDLIRDEIFSVRQRLVDQESVVLLGEYELFQEAMTQRVLDEGSTKIIQKFFSELKGDIEEYEIFGSIAEPVRALKTALPGFPDDAILAVKEFSQSGRIRERKLFIKFLSYFYQFRHQLGLRTRESLTPTIVAIEEALLEKNELSSMVSEEMDITSITNTKLVEMIQGVLISDSSLPKSVAYQLLHYIERKERILQYSFIGKNPSDEKSIASLKKFAVSAKQLADEAIRLKNNVVFRESVVLLGQYHAFENAMEVLAQNAEIAAIVRSFFDGLRTDLATYEQWIRRSSPASQSPDPAASSRAVQS